MSHLNLLEPKPLWSYFEEICKIPRLSKNEAGIREYLLDFASRNKLESRVDSVGNILIIRPPSKGLEKKKTVVLQSHLDMVGEKNAECPHNWKTDPIIPVISDGWVTANGTTLGADDGIGIASQMAVLTDKILLAGRIECLFTVDEESGMTGAINLQPDFFSGNTLLNLDSEDEGILYIGCAGGIDTIGTIEYSPVATDTDSAAFEIMISGLHGGHSGDEIHRDYANSVKLMTGLLQDLSDRFGISIGKFDGGNLRNAIPREARAIISMKRDLAALLQNRINTYLDDLQSKISTIEPGLKIICKSTEIPATIMDSENQVKLLKALADCPHGVIGWSKEMENLVETSTNLASVKFLENNVIEIITTQRSSNELSKHEIAKEVEKCFLLAGARVVHSKGYPGWKPNISSEILKIASTSYKRLFHQDPEVRAIHAGLECGLIYEKDKSKDIISFGPSIRGAHTPQEMINIESTGRFWNFLMDILQTIPEE